MDSHDAITQKHTVPKLQPSKGLSLETSLLVIFSVMFNVKHMRGMLLITTDNNFELVSSNTYNRGDGNKLNYANITLI